MLKSLAFLRNLWVAISSELAFHSLQAVVKPQLQPIKFAVPHSSEIVHASAESHLIWPVEKFFDDTLTMRHTNGNY